MPNPVLDKSYTFALAIIKIVKVLQSEQKEYILTKQLLRSGTSIGANISEATAAQSRKDFISKMAIASKEARETLYWLRLMRDSKILNSKQAEYLVTKNEELVRLLTSIVKSTQENTTKQ